MDKGEIWLTRISDQGLSFLFRADIHTPLGHLFSDVDLLAVDNDDDP